MNQVIQAKYQYLHDLITEKQFLETLQGAEKKDFMDRHAIFTEEEFFNFVGKSYSGEALCMYLTLLEMQFERGNYSPDLENFTITDCKSIIQNKIDIVCQIMGWNLKKISKDIPLTYKWVYN